MASLNSGCRQGASMKRTTMGVIGLFVLLAGIWALYETNQALDQVAGECRFSAQFGYQNNCDTWWSGTSFNTRSSTNPLGLPFLIVILLGVALVVQALREPNGKPSA